MATKIIKITPRLDRISQTARVIASMKHSTKRIAIGIAQRVQENCPPDKPIISGLYIGKSLRKTINAGEPFIDGNHLKNGIGDKTKMVPWWKAVEHGMSAKKGWHFVGTEIAPKLSGKGKHGEGFMVKGGKSKARKPQRMFAIEYRSNKGRVLSMLNAMMKKALK